jgi:hypothetical protein
MKKLILIGMMLLLMAGEAFAIRSFSRSENVGYSTANLIVGTADADSAVKKIVFFKGLTTATMVRFDSLTTVTNEDTLAVTGLKDGTQFFWYVQVIDSVNTIYEPTDFSGYTFTTTDFTQNLTITTGYSTASIIHDSVGYYVAPLDSLVFLWGKTSGTYDAGGDTITSVTHPDTSALTGLAEGVAFYVITIAYLADSSIVDTSAEFSFTTTDLSSSLSILRRNIDSLIVIIDSVDFCPDSLILQWGTGLAAITANADTNTSPNCPDTVTIVGLIEGGTYSLRVLYFLPDSSAIDTGAVTTYTRAHNKFVENAAFRWPDNFRTYLHWDFDSHLDDYSTGALPIDFRWLRIHVAIDGEDQWATSDSINVFLWSFEFGDSTAIDTIVVLEPDTITITPLKYRMYPGELTDSSMTYYPEFDWGTHYGVSADMSNNDGQEDSTTTLGIRSVHAVIEEIE